MVRARTLLLLVITATIVAAGCGSDANDKTSVESRYSEINSEGHGDGDTEGHDLAVGDNTPKDPKGRFFLHHGDSGPDVDALQARLIDLGAPIEKDDVFGDHTLQVVLQFQKAERLVTDGVVGTATWAALDAPRAPVDWNAPDVPDEHSTEAPTGTVPGEPQTPPTSGAAAQGDAHAVGSHKPTSQDPAGGAWVKAVITLSNETATFYDSSGKIVLQAPISSGHDGLTPVGAFHVQSKSPRAYASGGSGVYMDHMTRFNGGIGFHSIPKTAAGVDLPTPLGQAPVSHGCIRMADDQAKIVFDNLPIGAVVEVHR